MREPEFRPPLALVGKHLELVPLQTEHAPALSEAGRDPKVWTYIRSGAATTLSAMTAQIGVLLERQRAGTDLCFTVRRLPGHEPVGMTRFLRVDRESRGVEIGGTWYDPAYWRTPLNTEAKYLLLHHAFDVEHVHRVQLQTDARNVRSQRAIERLGAVREGQMREDVLMPDGVWRSSVLYSILESEWPAVRRSLEEKLARPWPTPA
ncbi:MAG TPA: GNAT family protein [Thermoplasmata archaeon]|nr:GNAT family protein [Thermoplasmata archaeon]